MKCEIPLRVPVLTGNQYNKNTVTNIVSRGKVGRIYGGRD